MLAEVSNTPWRERHYYLIDMHKELKVKRVSRFAVHGFRHELFVENKTTSETNTRSHREPQKRQNFRCDTGTDQAVRDQENIRRTVFKIPAMTIKVVMGIYYQALKLFLKKYLSLRTQTQRLKRLTVTK